MTPSTKKIIIGVALVVIVGLIWYSVAADKPETETEDNTSITRNDASDEALIDDTARIDAEMNGLGNDSATADAGVNDKPITQ